MAEQALAGMPGEEKIVYACDYYHWACSVPDNIKGI